MLVVWKSPSRKTMSPEQGDRVRVDIPNKDDPDFDEYHRRSGIVVERLVDDASEVTGDDRDDVLYQIKFEDVHIRIADAV